MADEPRPPSKIRDEMDEKVKELFEFNQNVAAVLRQQAMDFEFLGGLFGDQRQRCFEISVLIAELAATAAKHTGDIIMAQFGVEPLGPELGEDEDMVAKIDEDDDDDE